MPSVRQFVRLLLVVFVGPLPAGVTAAERPNILWITAEDMSPQLGCYGDPDARTPRLDAFAREAVRYTQAFATAPVCSPARSCLITGMYATSLGTQRLRSEFPVPAEIGPFTEALRAAGYYCANNVKTDYNVRDEAAFIRRAWDESSATAHWRGRKAGQPFFAVFNFMTTHQSRSSVWSQEEFEKEAGSKLSRAERHDPELVRLPPFYPDTAEARRAWARYHDCVTLMDLQVGQILDQLAIEGLANDTIVFFFSDHGMGMPRGKRCLYDSGLHVPLLVWFPKKWAHLAPVAAGGTTDRLVSFVDFAPTVLSLCGVPVPAHFQGRAFLGAKTAPARDYVYGARDRVDEAFDLSRSVRDRRWLYIRNFMPHLPWMQPETYSDASTFRQELKRLAAQGKLTNGAAAYAKAPRPLEELYDTVADPHQLHNLAGQPEHEATLEKLRTELRRWQMETRDAGFLTEPQWTERLGEKGAPWSLARYDRTYPLSRLLSAADVVGRDSARDQQRVWLTDANDGVRYWAAVGLNARTTLNESEQKALRAALTDASPVVRIEAASVLVRASGDPAALKVLADALANDSADIALHTARALELLGTAAKPLFLNMSARLADAREAETKGVVLEMFIRFSLETALGK